MQKANKLDAVFMGLGYIGLPTAAFAASKGLTVLGVDINPTVVETRAGDAQYDRTTGSGGSRYSEISRNGCGGDY